MLLNFNAILLLESMWALMNSTSNGPIDAYIVPAGDAHHSEYTAPVDDRRGFISNFTGSAGTAVIINGQKARLWTDGRYFTQALIELDLNHWELMRDGDIGVPTLADWLANELDGTKIGVDPMIYTMGEWENLDQLLSANGKELVQVDQNLVDQVWAENGEKPERSRLPVHILPIEYAGKNTSDKLIEVRAEMTKNNAEVLVITELDQISWLLNLRGKDDIPQNPVFFAYSIVTLTHLELFIYPEKLNANITSYLNTQTGNSFSTFGYEDVKTRVEDYNATIQDGKKIWVSKHCNYAISSTILASKRLMKLTPIAFMKIIKNPVEVEGMKQGHIRDASALIQFLYWLDKAMANDTMLPGLTEISVSDKLESFRRKQDFNQGLSFNTIAGSGPNGAIIHYRATPESDRHLSRDELFLLDSGGQYFDTTTDVTRTMSFGTPTEIQMECFTRVLKGQIALRLSVFPVKTIGNVLDSFARKSLWDAGLEYRHGTGHGIGSYLHVHEPPIGISYRPFPDDPGLQPNMYLSNEPGYYKVNEFGIRIENIVRVVHKNTTFGGEDFLTFEDITLVPIQRKMINVDLLTEEEIEYLDSYHQQVRSTIGEYMEEKEIDEKDKVIAWLIEQTLPLNSFAKNLLPSFVTIIFSSLSIFLTLN